MKHDAPHHWYARLARNSRFWILATAVTASVNIAGFVQLTLPSGSLQTIRLEQLYGFISLALLYIAILASPLTKVIPRLPGKDAYLHARRAIGVSAFYYGCLHVAIAFFGQLGGFRGFPYLNASYHASLLLGIFVLGVLFVMTATSLDWAVKVMGFHHWKLLHRTVYAASLALLLHIMLIGPHYDRGLSFLGVLTYLAAIVLLTLEGLRMRMAWRQARGRHD